MTSLRMPRSLAAMALAMLMACCVGISGDMYSEGLTVVVMREAETLRIRTVEFGRP